jgi:DNA-binding transcriptional regulator GbsR (MarR family)
MAQKVPEWEELAEQIGEFIALWGFKRIHGRIWCYLHLSAAPLDAGALVKRLRVSKALVSISLKDLLQYRVVLSAGTGKGGVQLYRSNPDIMEGILTVLRSRERKLLGRIQASFKNLEKLGEGHGIVDSSKVAELKDLIGAAEELLDAFLRFKSVDLSLWSRFAPGMELREGELR